jgi:hypothetical protein
VFAPTQKPNRARNVLIAADRPALRSSGDVLVHGLGGPASDSPQPTCPATAGLSFAADFCVEIALRSQCQISQARRAQGNAARFHRPWLISLISGNVHRGPPAPIPVGVGDSAVAVAVSVLVPVLLPQQNCRHGAPFQLLVDVGPIGPRRCRRFVERQWREEPPLQLGIAQSLRHRPRDGVGIFGDGACSPVHLIQHTRA